MEHLVALQLPWPAIKKILGCGKILGCVSHLTSFKRLTDSKIVENKNQKFFYVLSLSIKAIVYINVTERQLVA